jgi:hypothetical protein
LFTPRSRFLHAGKKTLVKNFTFGQFHRASGKNVGAQRWDSLLR